MNGVVAIQNVERLVSTLNILTEPISCKLVIVGKAISLTMAPGKSCVVFVY